ncbi:MAG: hypothetical protein M8467_05170 [Anaerolineae bacterium]|nr:hypothetical protein [Anaerolineae bacterium]
MNGTNWRETAGTLLCALLSLGAFVPLVVAAGRLPAALVLAISLACPIAWLLSLSWSGRDDGGLRRPAGAVAPGLRLRPLAVAVSERDTPAAR